MIETLEVDQIIVEHGTLPLDELYFELKPDSRNLGAVDYDALLAGKPQTLTPTRKATSTPQFMMR